jgi:hypothetical protein
MNSPHFFYSSLWTFPWDPVYLDPICLGTLVLEAWCCSLVIMPPGHLVPQTHMDSPITTQSCWVPGPGQGPRGSYEQTETQLQSQGAYMVCESQTKITWNKTNKQIPQAMLLAMFPYERWVKLWLNQMWLGSNLAFLTYWPCELDKLDNFSVIQFPQK